METYRKLIEKRKRRLWGSLILILNLNIFLLLAEQLYASKHKDIGNALGFTFGLIIGLFFLGILMFYRYTRALKDDSNLKKLYIEEYDERKKLIKDKAIKSAMFTMLILCLIVTSIAIYYNPIIVITLIITLYSAVLVTLGFKVYYNKKY